MTTPAPLKPQRLKKHDLIGLVTPASPIADASRIEKGVRYLESLGYRVAVGAGVGKTHGYLGGTDEDRLADLNSFFTDHRVKAIIAIRGGYGTTRLLSKLNYKMIAKNPKVITGFSDITALQLALWSKCRLITFHGPMAGVEMATTMDPFTEEMFWRSVTSSKKMGHVAFPIEAPPTVLRPGKAVGRLIGGNLSLIISLLGTSYFPDARGAILFAEEIAEEPYRVDRMITQLFNASIVSKCKAILAGQFTDCIPNDPAKPSLTVDHVLKEAAAQASGPFLSNLPFGHVPRKMTLPIGIRVEVNTAIPSVKYLEAAVTD